MISVHLKGYAHLRAYKYWRDRTDRVAVLAGTAGVRELELVAREFAPRDTHVHLREHRRDRLSNSIYVVYISALTPI